MADIIFTNETLPEGYCFTGWQRLFNDFTSLLHGALAGECGMFIIQEATPTDPDDRDKVWIKLGADGNFERIYLYTNGAWRSPHAMPTGMMVMADYAINTQVVLTHTYTDFDGGTLTGADPTATTGPFWEVMYAARFPLSVGTLPSSKAIAVGDLSSATEGEETHVLTKGELPEHQHFEFLADVHTGNVGTLLPTEYPYHHMLFSGSADIRSYAIQGQDAIESNCGLTSKIGSDTAHNNMPPYFGTYFLRRTSRIWYVA